MKIVEVKAAGLRRGTPEGGWSNELQPDDCVHTIISVHTDEGLTGWGSTFTTDQLTKGALTVLAPLLIGENPLEPQRVTEKLHQNTFWLGRGGSITHAISGVDIALWDLFGKAVGQPVSRLLGGRYREKVRPYASLLMREPARMRDELLPLREQNFRAFKIGWGPFGKQSYALDEAIVRAAREAIGPDCRLMVDAGASDAFWPQDFKWALRTARMLEAYDVTWFEEALRPDALEDYVCLRRAAMVPISGGEVLTRRQTFQPWIEQGAFDIVQPDATKVGGLSEQLRIGWMAEDHGVRLIPHGWNTAVGLASDLHLSTAFPHTDMVEYLTGSPFVDDLVQGGWHLDAEGMLAIPLTPGLGIEIDLDALHKYSDA
jgi:L-alanine-DL-glutamate epimerase-like enolase superfamily enzyme